MRRTLFYIPHELAGVPVFGVGWLLLAWLLIGGFLAWRVWRQRGWDRETQGQLLMLAVIAAAIVWVIPHIEEPIVRGVGVFPPVAAETGLPIRGYGTLLLCAVVLGVTLAANRAARAGLDPDLILGLAMAMVLGGIVGARLFFVLQYWPSIRGETLRETLVNLVSTNKGGLVVYGSLLGASAAFVVFAWRHRLPLLPLADLAAPSLALGLALGRVGCLMNGCCYGGACDYGWALSFPPDSPPYVDQLAKGEFFGITLAWDSERGARVTRLDQQGPFHGSGLSVGELIVRVNDLPITSEGALHYAMEQAGRRLRLQSDGGRIFAATIKDLPARSLPVHPTQLYSALNAGLLCCLTLAFYPFRTRHGQTIALLLTLYAGTRFLLELIRTDEGDFFASLTISQNISIAIAAAMVLLWYHILRQPKIVSATPA